MEKVVSDEYLFGGHLISCWLAAGLRMRRRGESAVRGGASGPSNAAEVQQRLQELDSPCYETRRLAAERLERWLGMPEMAAMLAEQFQQLIVQPELPFEVRWRISIWRTRLPPAKSEPPQSVSAEELGTSGPPVGR